MYRIVRVIVVLLTVWFDGVADGAFRIDDYRKPNWDYLEKLDRDNKREIRTFDKDGIVGVTIVANGTTIQVHGYLLCSEYELKNATFPSCQHVLIGASFVSVPKLESITVCLHGNPFSEPCQSKDNLKHVDPEDLGFIHPRYEPQYRVGDIAVLRLDDGLNNPIDNPKKWVYPKNNIKLETRPEPYYGFVSHKRGVTRWKESMTEKDTTLMRPFRNKHTYPVLDVCKNVSNAPRYYNGVFLGPFRSTDVKMEDDYAPLKPRTTYIFVAVIMYDNRKNLFPDHGLLINMDYDTVMGVFAFENEHIWNPVKHVAGSGNRNFHIWSNYVERPILHPDRNDDRRINVQHFSIVSYYLPWIYHVVKTDTIDLMVGDTDEEESTTMDSSTTDRSFEITTPITDLPDTYYDSDGAFYGVEFNVNPCGKAVGKAHRRLPSALCTAAMCCFTLCAPLLSALNWF